MDATAETEDLAMETETIETGSAAPSTAEVAASS